ncbi:DUF4097 domain-containing protein [Streptomyces sp. NPDC048604]|uniref:DUF4097 family beta strand repeat-containing protein n=1 Tax=Streptomyces sp. NPDC048604 TaxID=3365578 RepID=UPI0037150868
MPSYATPKPITAILEFEIGHVRITAGERRDTVVEVAPSDATEPLDVQAAEQTVVGYADGTLTLKGPKKHHLFGRKSGSVDVTVTLPAGSNLRSVSPVGDYAAEGTLGRCTVRTSLGRIRIERADSVDLRTSHGDVRVDRTAGDAEVHAAGRIELGRIGGAATVVNANGDTAVAEITGDLKARAANGRITVGVARGSVEAASDNGGIGVHDVARGAVRLEAAVGDVEVGVRESCAARLDVRSGFGRVRNALGTEQSPGGADERVDIHARARVGDVLIRRP